MRALMSMLVAVLAAPLSVVAAPTGNIMAARQAPVAPTPCVRQDPPPTQEETEARFNDFVEKFVGRSKSIAKAFEYIAEDYINHNPLAQNGFKSAWDILSPFWDSSPTTYLRHTIDGDMSWVNYRSSFGQIVDRFRWEGGCIVEHWDQGEQYPTS
ncbi:hypothetical protein MYCTH_2307822 [Thermothelomyces thermophilus ATCC 42464]|uniref:SnoaL-like domain-containing protein n=1 Tax=Thermothelomyces thermophilus (strain ATCC 42464 / BCRC 31852 / DSM 1799) TaxID=573729 RepID=G2QGW5_THET4|nr:uncharacterized protein MYCTH_2307822 [Thermothelomyces thermophilus ATCC 42464]AEO59472.1 hypothetical protein MYCTH_2307822 [Thermothelomyces thermophilus ATCC 42464]